VSAIEIPSVPQGPEPASEPALVIRAEGRAASRWYRQPALVAGIVILAVVVGLALAAPLITSYDPIAQNLNETLLGPSAHHLLGTDQLGRDTFTRLLYGLRLDLRIAFIAVLFPFVLGIVLGSLAGYFGGWADTAIMRLVDIVVAFPFYVLLIALVFVLGPGERSIYLAITLGLVSAWMRASKLQVIKAQADPAPE
jgi:peptide/nickel transport system permease protein